MYHNVVPDNAPFGYKYQGITIKKSEFNKHISILSRVFKIVPLAEYVNYLKNNEKIPNNILALTFDDGTYKTVEAISPILEKARVPVTIFTSTCQLDSGRLIWAGYINALSYDSNYQSIDIDGYSFKLDSKEARLFCKDSLYKLALDSGSPVEFINQLSKKHPLNKDVFEYYRGLDSSQIRDVTKLGLINIQSHGHNHTHLSNESSEKQLFELKESKQILESIKQQEITLFAYPSGDYNTKTIDLLMDSGYSAAFAVNPNKVSDNLLFEIPRTGVFSGSVVKLVIKIFLQKIKQCI